MLDLVLVILLKFLLYASLTFLVLSVLGIIFILYITSKGDDSEENGEIIGKLLLISIISFFTALSLPSDNVLSKLKTGIEYKLIKEYKTNTK